MEPFRFIKDASTYQTDLHLFKKQSNALRGSISNLTLV